MTAPPIASILVVEDDPKQLRLYSKALRGYRLTCVTSGTAALGALRDTSPDVIILDHVLGEGERGADFLPKLKAAAAHVPIIVVSGTLAIRDQLKALQGPSGAHFVLEKPVDIDQLERTVEIAVTECGLGEAVKMLRSLENAEKVDHDEPDRRFTERLARQHGLLRRLRGTTERPNISLFSREYQVSRKTIIRDLRDLIQRGQLPAEIYPEWQSELGDDTA